MRKTVTDPGSAISVLAERLDRVESRLGAIDEVREDVKTLGRGLADALTQTRTLADHLNRRIIGAPNHKDRAASNGFAASDAGLGGGADDGPNGEDVDDGEQPNWLTVTDPTTAIQWLTDAAAFAGDVLAPLGYELSSGCWPLHALTVVEVIALQHQFRSAYGTADPSAVSEWLSRWFPGARARISQDLSGCFGERAHRVKGRAYELPRLNPVHVATWWAETHGTAPDCIEAFSLTPIR